MCRAQCQRAVQARCSRFSQEHAPTVLPVCPASTCPSVLPTRVLTAMTLAPASLALRPAAARTSLRTRATAAHLALPVPNPLAQPTTRCTTPALAAFLAPPSAERAPSTPILWISARVARLVLFLPADTAWKSLTTCAHAQPAKCPLAPRASKSTRPQDAVVLPAPASSALSAPCSAQPTVNARC